MQKHGKSLWHAIFIATKGLPCALRDHLICAATSAAKFSCFFSMPSPSW